MLSNLQFLQKHCLILKLVLFHGTRSAPNEMLWGHHITSELSKLCRVLYAKPALSKLPNSFVKQDSRIDLVLSSYDVGLLSRVLFSLKGIKMNGKVYSEPVDHVCPPISDYFKLESSNPRLEALRSRLTKQWSRRKHVSGFYRYNESAAVHVSPWIFDMQPVKNVVTSENNTVALNNRNLMKSQYELSDHKGSRFFQEERGLKMDPKPLTQLRDDQATGSDKYLKINPILYESFDSMPGSLRKWLDNVVDEDVEPDPKDRDRLDILLHGFKGFN